MTLIDALAVVAAVVVVVLFVLACRGAARTLREQYDEFRRYEQMKTKDETGPLDGVGGNPDEETDSI